MKLNKSILVQFAFCCFFILIETQAGAQYFTTSRSEEGIEIKEQGKKVLFYQVRPKTVDGKYERAGYVHPLYSLDEKSLTDDMPKDHPYHRGIFWAWHQIKLKDKNIAEGWTCENITWNPIKVEIKQNKKSATLHSEVLWKSVLSDNKQESIIREDTRIRVHRST